MSSAAQILANRQNAQLSSGPTSETGKAKSAKNALRDEGAPLSEPKTQRKLALTGRTVLLPGDDADRYEQHLLAYQKDFKPVGEREIELVQALADNLWRLDRISGLEEAIFVKGCSEFTGLVDDIDPDQRLTMLQMHTYLAYERQFRNLHIQEARLHRQREKLNAEIKQLQNERRQKEKAELAMAAKAYLAAKAENKPFDQAEFGFEFSTEDVENCLQGLRAAAISDQLMKNGRPASSQHSKAA